MCSALNGYLDVVNFLLHHGANIREYRRKHDLSRRVRLSELIAARAWEGEVQ